MTFDRVMAWKFDSAPAELRALHTGRQRPIWLTFIPKKIFGVDFEAVIVAQTGLIDLDRRQTDAGDIVYFGSSDPVPLLSAIDLMRLDDFTLDPDLNFRIAGPKEMTEPSKGAASAHRENCSFSGNDGKYTDVNNELRGSACRRQRSYFFRQKTLLPY